VTCVTVGAPSRSYVTVADGLEAAVRVFCLIVLGLALSLRMVAFAMDNAAEAATGAAVAQSIAAVQR